MLALGLQINTIKNRRQHGPELISNGGFDTDATGWTASNATLSVVSGAINIADNGAYSSGYQAVTTVIGKNYRLTFDIVTKDVADAIVSFGATQPSGLTYGDTAIAYPTTGSYVRTFVATSTSTYVSLCSAGTYSNSYDNISVKEVLPVYGPELVTNSGFDTDTTGWSVSVDGSITWQSGEIKVENTTGVDVGTAYQAINLTAGVNYKIEADVTVISTVRAQFTLNSTNLFSTILAGSDNNTTTGVKTFNHTPDTTTTYYLILAHRGDNSIGKYAQFDNVSVKEVI